MKVCHQFQRARVQVQQRKSADWVREQACTGQQKSQPPPSTDDTRSSPPPAGQPPSERAKEKSPFHVRPAIGSRHEKKKNGIDARR